MDLVRNPGVPRARDYSQQGLQQGRGLVGARCPRLRDGRRLPAVLRRPADPDLREDRGREATVPLAFRLRPERPAAQPAADRPHQEVRQPEGGCERHQGSQVVRQYRLDSSLPKENRGPVHTEVQGARGYQ